MRLPSLARFAASAKAVFTRQEELTALQHLESINDAVQTLTVAVDGYRGGLLAAAPLSGHEGAIIHAMNRAIKYFKTVEVPPEAEAEAEAQEIVEFTRNTLLPTMQAVVKAMQDKKDAFAASNLLGILLAEMQDLRNLTGELAQALLAKVPPRYADESGRLIGAVEAAFDDVVKFFS